MEFDLAAYHDVGSDQPGDGISCFLIDGSKTTGPGGRGEALGYALLQKDTKPGVTAGYLGSASTIRAFSNPIEAGTGGPGQKPNSMVLCGSGDGNNGFNHLTGATLPHDLSLTRQAPARVHPTVLDGKATAGFRPPGGVQELIADFQVPHGNGPEPLPDTFKPGLSAATGGSTSNYLVGNLVISLRLASSQKLRSNAYQNGEKFAYPYEFTLTAGQADVRRWSFSFDVPEGATVKKDSGAWYAVVQDGSNGVVEIASPDDETHVVFANESLSVDITVDYPDQNDAHNTVANLSRSRTSGHRGPENTRQDSSCVARVRAVPPRATPAEAGRSHRWTPGPVLVRLCAGSTFASACFTQGRDTVELPSPQSAFPKPCGPTRHRSTEGFASCDGGGLASGADAWRAANVACPCRPSARCEAHRHEASSPGYHPPADCDEGSAMTDTTPIPPPLPATPPARPRNPWRTATICLSLALAATSTALGYTLATSEDAHPRATPAPQPSVWQDTRPPADAPPARTPSPSAKAGFEIGQEARNAGAVVTVTKVEEGGSITLGPDNGESGGIQKAGDDAKYVTVTTTVFNDAKKSMDLTCSLPITNALIDREGRRYDSVEDLYRIEGNPECNAQLQPGFEDDMQFVYRIPKTAEIAEWEFAELDFASHTERTPTTVRLTDRTRQEG